MRTFGTERELAVRAWLWAACMVAIILIMVLCASCTRDPSIDAAQRGPGVTLYELGHQSWCAQPPGIQEC